MTKKTRLKIGEFSKMMQVTVKKKVKYFMKKVKSPPLPHSMAHPGRIL